MKLSKFFMGVYGCQMNFSDAERMAGILESGGLSRADDMAFADVIILVTCCVRQSAEDKIFGKIGEVKKLKREKRGLIFGITGCLAQKDGEAMMTRAHHIDFVLGTGKIGEILNVINEIASERSHISDTVLDFPAENVPVSRDGKISAWIPIMYGCNNFCTYCIVPYVRGRERSRLPEDILAEIKKAADDGFHEITLLGQNVNSYGKDHGRADFADLLEMADEIPGIWRIRFMTSHPKDLSDRVIETIKQSKHICEHFHLPVQYGSDRILKAMNRSYTTGYYRELISKIRENIPKVSITTDFIVGFPGETERDFEETLNFMREMKFDAAYTFIYSRRTGTPAAEMPDQIDDATKHNRLRRMMDTQDEISLRINEKYFGKTVQVLSEGESRKDKKIWTGRTRSGKIVLWSHSDEKAGELINIKITQTQTWLLKGELEKGAV